MKTGIDLSEVVSASEYTQPIIVKRNYNGRYFQGKFIEETKDIVLNAVVSATDSKDLVFVPEGDRNSVNKTIHTVEPLYMTRTGATQNDTATSDIVIYEGEPYKVTAVIFAGDYGYYKTVVSSLGADR